MCLLSDINQSENDGILYSRPFEDIENNNKSDLDEKRIKEIITDYKNGKEITNEFLKSIIKRIEVYSDLKIEIIFNL